MAGEVKLTATLPDGKQVERRTHRAYTHVVAGKTEAGTWWAFRWSQGLVNATKGMGEASKWTTDPRLRKSICEVRLVEVNDPRNVNA